MKTKYALLLPALLVSLPLLFSRCELFSQSALWGFEEMDKRVTPSDPPLTACPVLIPEDSHVKERAGCAFNKGARASETLGISDEVASTLPIRHVIVLMKENRSFDHLFSSLYKTQPQVQPVPKSYANPDGNGDLIFPRHAATTCFDGDPGHQKDSMHTQINGGKMDGFILSALKTTTVATGQSYSGDGHYVMDEFDETDLPFYYWLANTYAINDNHFASNASGTYAIRDFMMFGTNAGVFDTGLSYPPPNTPSIFQLIQNSKQGYTWRAYSDSPPFSGALGWNKTYPAVRTMDNFISDVKNGNLPNVAFVDGVDNTSDDHPGDTAISDLQTGEAWTKKIYDAVTASAQYWPRTAIILTHDEGGGFHDHVKPPQACAPVPGDVSADATELGGRVPLIMISPWAKKHSVSHVQNDHTAITRFIETIFGLPALTARDANSDALLDMLDFSCDQSKNLTPPGPVPEAGQGGCR